MAEFTKSKHDYDFPSNSSSSKTIFVGDLSFFCTELELAMAFNPFGEIAALEIKRGRYGDSLMHGFLEYTTEIAAHNAITEMNGKKFMGRKIRYVYCYERTIVVHSMIIFFRLFLQSESYQR